MKANLKGVQLVGADLMNAQLSNANLEGADLQNAQLKGANLDHANLKGANLVGAILENASLVEANLEGTSLDGSRFDNSDICNANFRKAQFGTANFHNAQFSKDTLGLGRMSQTEQRKMSLIDIESMELEVDLSDLGKEPDKGNIITFEFVIGVVGPANAALQSLTMPNDLDQEDRDLIDELKQRVMELDQQLAQLGPEGDASEIVAPEIPFWKRAFETLVLQTAANFSAQGAAFSAGFIAGMLYHTCSPDGAGLWT